MEWKEVKIYTTTEGIEPVSAMPFRNWCNWYSGRR